MLQHALYDDVILLRKIADGNEQAMKQLFDTYHSRLFIYISRLIRSDQVAEELVMDVFMKIWTGRDMLSRIDNFDAFLFRIAHNKSIDFLRSPAANRQFKGLLADELEQASAERADSSLLLKEYEQKVRDAILLLSPQRRKIYSLSRDEELSHDQIARQLNISRATVNNQIVEARRFVKNHVAETMDLAFFLLVAGSL